MSRTTVLVITLFLLASVSAPAYADDLTPFISQPNCEEGRQPGKRGCYVPFFLDTGELFNDTNRNKVVFEQEFALGDGWIPRTSGHVQLSADSVLPKGTIVRVTLADAKDTPDGRSYLLRNLELTVLVRPATTPRPAPSLFIRDYSPWEHSELKEAYMLGFSPGEHVRMEFIAPPRSSMRIIFEKVFFPGLPGLFRASHRHFQSKIEMPPYLVPIPSKAICGTEDNRELSSNAAIARLRQDQGDLLEICTGFIADCPAGPGKCFLSAGHCLIRDHADSARFNIPPSNPSTCKPNPPTAESIFSIDKSTVIAIHEPEQANDWAVMRLVPNQVTGKTAFEQQGASLSLRTASLPVLGSTLRMRGYGIDSTGDVLAGPNNPCEEGFCASGDGERNRVQQTSSGRFIQINADKQIAYDIDSCGGNSGSPVVFAFLNQAMAIHTTSGCDAQDPSQRVNIGTNIQHPILSRALGNVFDVKPSNVVVRHDVAMNAAGDGVIVWEENLFTGARRIKARLIAPNLKMSNELELDTTFGPALPHPKVDITPDGRFVVVHNVKGQTHNANGDVVAPSFFLTEGVPLTSARSPDVAISPSSNFTAIWHGVKGVNGTYLQLRRFLFVGLPLTDALDVAELDDPNNTTSSIQSNSAGTSLVLWRVSTNNPLARVYEPFGSAVSSAFSISAPSAELLDDGTILAVSIEDPGTFLPNKIVGQRYTKTGLLMGQPFDLVFDTFTVDRNPRIVSMHSSGFFVTWTRAQDTAMAQQFSLDTRSVADVFDVSAGDDYVLAARDAGLFVVSGPVRSQFILKSSDPAAAANTPEIFSDGFESGDTLTWSATVGGTG